MFFYFFYCLSVNSFAQNPFKNGFDTGFQKGYCYNQLGCIAPVPPIAPIPRINENSNSYQDGYLNGFLTGKALREHDVIEQKKTVDITPHYTEPVRPAAYKSNGYVNPVDLDLLKEVLAYKQKLFDTRGDWIQERINDLTTLNYCLLSVKQKGGYDSITHQINQVVSLLNSAPMDFTDTNLFNEIAQTLWGIYQNLFSYFKAQ